MSTILSQLKPLKIGDLTAKLPIIQGGMGVGISLSSLAGAVAGAGGIGIISTAQIGFREPDFAEHPQEANLRAIGSELQKARAIAKGGIVGFNIMVATKNYAEYVKTAVKAGADLIISGAGLPVSLPEYVKGTATKIAPIVSSVKAATVICRMWDRKYQTAPDLVVVEGPLAGGHLGFDREKLTELEVDTPHAAETFHRAEYDEEVRGIIALVKKYAQKYGKSIPVVTAGGIYDHADVMHWWPKHGKDMDTFRAEVAAAVKGEAGMTVEEAKRVLKAKAGLSDTTITYLYNYRWGDDLLLKLAAAMEGK